jgi:uncharacterized protein (TIGR03067 family)
VAAVAGVLATGGPAPDAAVRAEMAKLAATWQMVSGENDGLRAPEACAQLHTYVLTADGTCTTAAGDTILSQGAYVIDPGKTPKAVDFQARTGPLAGKALHCIYDCTSDAIVLCFCATRTDRPTEFMAAAGSHHVRMVYKRAAPR